MPTQPAHVQIMLRDIASARKLHKVRRSVTLQCIHNACLAPRVHHQTTQRHNLMSSHPAHCRFCSAAAACLWLMPV